MRRKAVRREAAEMGILQNRKEQPMCDDPIMKTCPICRVSYNEDSMDYPVCFRCLCKNMTFDTAEKYGDERKINVEVNAFWAKLFPPAMINELLREKADEYKSIFPFMAREDTDNFFKDDLGDFADWLKERSTPKWRIIDD